MVQKHKVPGRSHAILMHVYGWDYTYRIPRHVYVARTSLAVLVSSVKLHVSAPPPPLSQVFGTDVHEKTYKDTHGKTCKDTHKETHARTHARTDIRTCKDRHKDMHEDADFAEWFVRLPISGMPAPRFNDHEDSVPAGKDPIGAWGGDGGGWEEGCDGVGEGILAAQRRNPNSRKLSLPRPAS